MQDDSKMFLGFGCGWLILVLVVNIALIAAIAIAVKWVIS